MAAVGEGSRQEMKKKHAVGRDNRRGGHEVPRGFEPRSLDFFTASCGGFRPAVR